jgi:hypothetical protein
MFGLPLQLHPHPGDPILYPRRSPRTHTCRVQIKKRFHLPEPFRQPSIARLALHAASASRSAGQRLRKCARSRKMACDLSCEMRLS